VQRNNVPQNFKGDFLAFFVVPIIFLALTFITAVMIMSSQMVEPILNRTMQSMGVSAANQQIPANIFSNLNNFNTYLPIIFFFVMMGVIFSTVLLSTNPLEWLVGVIYAPLIYYLSAYVSNMAKTMLTTQVTLAGNVTLAGAIAKLPLPVQILANLPTITFLFALLYIVALALRIWFYPVNPNQNQQR
jgi:hypothetical protein